MDRIITYSFGENFIKKLSDFVEENFLRLNKDISKLAFVFGGKRPSLFLKKELAGRTKKSFFSPMFFSIDEFFVYILSKKETFNRITDLDASFIIYDLAKEIAPDILKGREDFSRFLPWAREILTFIEQLDLEDVKIEFLKNVQTNAAVGFDVPDNINTLLQNIISIREAYNDILKRKKTYTRGLIYLLASEFIEKIDLDEFDEVLFCNMFYLHKTEEKVIKNIYKRNKAFVFFQGDEKEWQVLDKVGRNFSCHIRPEKILEPEYNINILAGFDTHSQVCLVREVLGKIKNKDNTVIVLPNPDNIVPLLCEITSCVKEFNVSVGYPLKRNLLYSLFECIFKAQNTRRENEYYSRDYLRVLSHPLVKNLKILAEPFITRILIHKIEEILIGREETRISGSLFIDLKDIQVLNELYDISVNTIAGTGVEIDREELKTVVKKLHDILFYSWEEINSFYGFSVALEKFLNILVENSFFGDYHPNLNIIDKIFLIKEELRNLFFNKEKFSKDDIFKIFENRINNEIISFSGSPLKGLQILGLFETRSLDFENVIVMDANESILPKLRVYEPLIPREVMLNLGLDRLEKDEEIQRYQFMRLIHSAKNVYLIYEESKDKEKSRFVEELIWNKQKQSNSLDVIPVTRAGFKLSVLPRKTEIRKNKGIIDFLKKFKYSASCINTYINCPLRFYYRFVLGLEEKEDLLEEPESVDIGNFVHGLLDKTFRKFVGRKPFIDGKFREYFFRVMDEDFKGTFEKRMKSDSFLLKDILRIRLDQFLNKEEERDVKQVLSIEEKFSQEIRLRDEYFNFVCRIDRVDMLNDGSILIIDYKTGSMESMPKSIEKLESMEFTRDAIKNTIRSFQLPLYFHFMSKIYNNNIMDVALYYLKDTKLKEYLKEDKNDTIIRGKILNMLIKSLEFVIYEILNPEVAFSADYEDVNYCENCPFYYLCR